MEISSTLVILLARETWIWTTGATCQMIIQPLTTDDLNICVFTHLWTNWHFQAKWYIYSPTRNHVYASKRSCFCSYFLFWGFYSDPHVCLSVFHFALVTRHSIMWASWSTHLFLSDPNQIYCSVLPSSSTQSQACSPSSERRTAQLGEWLFVKLYCVCAWVVRWQTLSEISASEIRVGCKSVVLHLYINKISIWRRVMRDALYSQTVFQVLIVILGHWCCCMQSKTTSSIYTESPSGKNRTFAFSNALLSCVWLCTLA